jgi:hypothetical protein
MGALSRLSGAACGVRGAGIHRVGASEELFGAATLGLRRSLDTNGRRVVEIGLLVVEQRLMFVASALRVIEHVL